MLNNKNGRVYTETHHTCSETENLVWLTPLASLVPFVSLLASSAQRQS